MCINLFYLHVYYLGEEEGLAQIYTLYFYRKPQSENIQKEDTLNKNQQIHKSSTC